MSQETFRCLVVQQPWAWAILSGAKDIENRTWATNYRGPIIIQASATKTVVNQIRKTSSSSFPTIEFTYGAMIGVVDLVDIIPLSEDLEANPWASGPYCWRLANPRCFTKPIPDKGKLKLYTLPVSISPLVLAAIESARTPKADTAAAVWVRELTHLDTADERFEGLFFSYIDLKDASNLMRLAQKAISQKGDSAAYAYRAMANFYNQDYEAAVADSSHAIDLYPLNERAFRIRSISYLNLHKPDLAKRDQRKADELRINT
jgi:hypothetical protein